MSREKMFTREISYTKVSALVCDIASATVTTKEFTVPFESNDNTKLLAYLQKTVQTPAEPIVSITNKETITKLYGCTVAEFLSVAKELDENRKVIEE